MWHRGMLGTFACTWAARSGNKVRPHPAYTATINRQRVCYSNTMIITLTFVKKYNLRKFEFHGRACPQLHHLYAVLEQISKNMSQTKRGECSLDTMNGSLE